jgi:hypothetical protein
MHDSILLCASLACCLASCTAADDDGFDADNSVELGAQSPAVLNSFIKFRNVKSGLCIGVDGGSTANGALLKQFACAGTSIPNNQIWLMDTLDINAGLHRFKNSKSNLCLGVVNASINAGANIAQFGCSGTSPPNNQLWTDIFMGGEGFRNSKSGKCLGVDGASTAAGAQIKQFPCDGTLNQQWTTNI